MTLPAPTAQQIDGRILSAAIVAQIQTATQLLQKEKGIQPGLAVVIVGEDPASKVYVRTKTLRAQNCGFHAITHRLPEGIAQEALFDVIDRLNADPKIHGILVQLPLPASLEARSVVARISPHKDVDGLHPLNAGLLMTGALDQAMIPCTPAGCLRLVQHALGHALAGQTAVIVGRSSLVGKPLAHLLLQEDCTVTVAHSKTHALPEVTRGADILIAAVGRPALIRGNWIKPGSVVIDVGINRVVDPLSGNTHLVGDVAFEEACAVAGAITPVPGGVGQMTTAMLMLNTLNAARRTHHLEDFIPF